MTAIVIGGIFYDTESGHVVMRAMPLLLGALCCLAIAYRYYSAFLAAKVAVLDDSRLTPAHRFNDGQNYHSTSKWVLFGHHFAAISGAGPLIGPVLAIQYGYMPGLLWLLIGVCLAGAVQDMLVLAASVRRGGKSLAEIARAELGPWANRVVSAAILFIVVIALAGLGVVVVKALGGEEVKLPAGMQIILPPGERPGYVLEPSERENSSQPLIVKSSKLTEAFLRLKSHSHPYIVEFPEGCRIRYTSSDPETTRPESFRVFIPAEADLSRDGDEREGETVVLPQGVVQLIPGSSWGVFTIACTIPIALLVGWYMYRFRPGHTVEASLIGATLTLAAVVAGNWIPGSPWESYFALGKGQTVFALCAYGFVASVLPVWLLLAPRDYLSSFLKIGTIALLVVGVFWANPKLPSPAYNPVFVHGGPTFQGHLFPFVFICIMCGAISGFHALVSSGTTPKMVDRESHIRPIGYGAMLMEGLVGIMALIAAASLDPKLYYDINVPLDQAHKWQQPLDKMYVELGNVDSLEHLNLAQVEQKVGGESLRGRTGGAVTLAVGMSHILTKPLSELGLPFDTLMKYWYHFAIMFEALFILTTIDAGTRIGRFLVQEALGSIHPKFAQTDWWPSALLATFLVTACWGVLVATGSVATIWPMFGIANQLLAVIALALVTTVLFNSGRGKYAPVTVLPMLFVIATTMTAGVQMCGGKFLELMRDDKTMLTGALSLAMTVFVMTCVAALLILAVSRWILAAKGLIPVEEDLTAKTPRTPRTEREKEERREEREV
jgi:carbon starvation protein